MKVLVEYNYYSLKKITKIQSEFIPISNDATFKQLLEILETRYGKKLIDLIADNQFKKIKIPVIINGFVNNDFNYTLKNNDKINFLAFAVSG